MTDNTIFEVIIVGGSFSGLAAGMTLGRSLRKVLIIDSGKPCNLKAPYSHNFITQDGIPPAEIAAIARGQVAKYDTVSFIDGTATSCIKGERGFKIQTEDGRTFTGEKLIFATGIKDVMPDIPGYTDCWGTSVFHCPYCHGYEIKNKKTGILDNGDPAFEFAVLLSNWTSQLTLYTNGKTTLSEEQTAKLQQRNIEMIETEIKQFEHADGVLHGIALMDGKKFPIEALYVSSSFVQHCTIPELLGCELTEEGYINVDAAQKTSVPGVFACGDNCVRMRSIANAVSMGTTAGMVVNREIILERNGLE